MFQNENTAKKIFRYDFTIYFIGYFGFTFSYVKNLDPKRKFKE